MNKCYQRLDMSENIVFNWVTREWAYNMNVLHGIRFSRWEINKTVSSHSTEQTPIAFNDLPWSPREAN